MTFTAKLALVLMLTATVTALDAETTNGTNLTSSTTTTTTTRNPLHGRCAGTPCGPKNASYVCGSDCECFATNRKGRRVWIGRPHRQYSSGFCQLVI
uniref:Secreted protein n=1 Tax=Rhipicephalus appendiculatus TaxID=34631 RepID=A0A131YBL9_RHIAP